MSKITQQLERVAAMPASELTTEWQRLWKASAPRLLSDLLRIGLAYRVQEEGAR